MFHVLLGDGQSGVAIRGDTGETEESLLYSQVLERQSHHTPWGATWKECQGNQLNQAGREPRKREDLCASTFTRGQDGIHKKRCKGTSLMPLKVTRSGDGRKRNLWQGPTYHIGVPGHLGRVLTAYLQGCWGNRKEKIKTVYKVLEFTIHGVS